MFVKEAQFVENLEPDPDFKNFRASSDFKSPLPYEQFLEGLDLDNEYYVRENLVGALHADKLFKDFLLYFDQLIHEKKLPEVRKDKELIGAIHKRIKRAFDILQMSLRNLAYGEHVYFQGAKDYDKKLALMKSTMSRNRGENFSKIFDKARTEYIEQLEPVKVENPAILKPNLRIFQED
jgi:hypothetical protein